MKLRYLIAVLCACPTLAQAVIYKAVDADGHVTYSSTPIKGGKKIILEPLPTMAPPGRPGKASPEGFPKVTGETQKARDESRRKILEDELASEEKLLDEAKQKLKVAEDTPMVYHKDGKTFRNVPKYQENVKAAQDEVKLHQDNIEALKAELSKVR